MLPVFLHIDRPRRDQDVSLVVTPEGVLTVIDPSKVLLPTPAKNQPSCQPEGNFQITLDVHNFTPEEISVKTGDNFLIVEASHGEKKDDQGWVKRYFSRRYALPDGCNHDAIVSRLSSDGILTVTAPVEISRNERIVPIVQIGPVRGQEKVEVGDGEAAENIEIV